MPSAYTRVGAAAGYRPSKDITEEPRKKRGRPPEPRSSSSLLKSTTTKKKTPPKNGAPPAKRGRPRLNIVNTARLGTKAVTATREKIQAIGDAIQGMREEGITEQNQLQFRELLTSFDERIEDLYRELLELERAHSVTQLSLAEFCRDNAYGDLTFFPGAGELESPLFQ
jgi:hypothetical protein